jgi:lysophospholipase L1-like esterase
VRPWAPVPPFHLALVLAATVAAATAAQARRAALWDGAWTAAPAVAGAAVDDRTLRLVVDPHRGGRAARVRLSNRFGSGPLVVRRVTLARSSAGAGVVAGTLRPVRFAGRRRVTLPRGAEVVSDRIGLRFRAFHDLSVSLYVPRAAGPATVHPLATEPSSYAATGDHTADAGATAFGAPSVSWAYLAGIDVRARRRVHTVVALGDSITDGFRSEVARPAGARDTRWPDVFARRLARAHRPYSVVNQGISGNRLRLDGEISIYGPSALARLDTDVLAVPGVTDVILLEGINDLGQAPPATAAQVIAAQRQVITRLHDAGLRVLVGTLTPAGGNAGATSGDGGADDRRLTVNRWIRHSRLPDAVIDFDAAVRDPAAPDRLLPAYDSGDHLHPNARGYRTMAAAVPLRLFPRR